MAPPRPAPAPHAIAPQASVLTPPARRSPWQRDVVELIDREADMLNRGRSETSLQGLRKRLANLFLQFIETPEFNPEAARFQKVPPELILRANVTPIPS